MRYFLLLFLAGCSFQAGLSIHSTEFDNPEIKLDTLLGVVRAERREGHITGFCEHVTAITQTEVGGGLNHCGALYNF